MSRVKRKYYPYFKEGVEVCQIDRTFSDEIAVRLPCGYFQRFWYDYTDSEAYEAILKMKEENFPSS